jgi:drug/metabolite transporter superfamily protein YnfA
LPVAPLDDQSKKRNQNLPGMGGVFNVVNMHAYHYAGNNPVRYVDPDGENPNDSIFGSSFDPFEDFINFWGSLLGDIFAFFGYKTAQNNITTRGQYYLKVFDKNNIAALSKISTASSYASLSFLAIGQPVAAVAASGVGLVADGMLIVHDWVEALKNNDQAGMNKAVRDGIFIVAGLTVGGLVGSSVDKALSITADGKTITHIITGKDWEDFQKTVRNEFGHLSGSTVEAILGAAKKAFFDE